jgi:pSer/pThr/pTyr-binding forkhead associated (FHA) protein
MNLTLHVQPPRGRSFEFQHAGPVIRIGRDPGLDLVLDSAHDNVSWEHARVTLTDKAATLTDLGSTNGTYLNGSLDRIKTCALKIGDEVQLGLTGPRLKVLALQLANGATEAPAEPRRPRNGIVVAPAAVSATRQLLIETQVLHRHTIAMLAGVFLFLLLLISTVIWLLNRQVDQTQARVDDAQQALESVKERQDLAELKLDQIVAEVRGVAGRMDEYNRQQKEAREQDRARIEQTVAAAQREAARFNNEMQAELRRLQEQGRQLAANKKPVADINELNRVRGGGLPAGNNAPALKFEPGLVMSIRKKDSANKKQFDYENVALVHANGESLYLQWFEDRPKEVKVDDIETIVIRNQMYQLDPKTKLFQPAMAFFQLDRASTQFNRVSYLDDDLASFQRGCVVGETPNFCMVRRTSNGLTLVAPMRVFGSLAFPAKSIQEIVTNFGVFTWSETERDYVFQTHQQIADKLNAERDQKRKEKYEEEWKKRKEAYQALTDRLRAARPNWWGWW